MKILPLVLLVSALSLAGGAAASGLVRHGAPPAGSAAEADVARVAAAIEDLQREQRVLRETVDRLALAAPPVQARVSQDEIEAAVARVLDERRDGEALAAAAPAAATAAADDELDVEQAMASLLDPELDQLEREQLWQKIREAGLLDDVVALFEARAKANPNDPKLQVDLAKAYLQKIFEVGNGPLAGVWATKADNTFDAALALDDHNWDARFSKAVSLSFWPPIFGKQAEAISQFETLLGQQQAGALQPQYAQTYLWLGNLYQQSGQLDLAKQTWAAGLQYFPSDSDLAEKLKAY